MENMILNTFALVFAPLAAGLIIFCGLFKNNMIVIRRFAKWFSALYTIYCAAFFLNYNTNAQIGYVANTSFSFLGKNTPHFALAQDVLGSLFLCVLALSVLACLVVAKSTVTGKHRLFYSFILFFEAAAASLMCSQDFYMFLISLFFEIMCVWIIVMNFSTSKARAGADTYLGLNSFSAVFLTGIIAVLYAVFASHDVELNASGLINSGADLAGLIQIMGFCGFFIVSAVKIPVFPFHRPLSNIIQNSNAASACVFLGEFLLGYYIFIKYCMYAFSSVFQILAPVIAIAAMLGICYFGILAIGQTDLKKSFAYFCFSQTGIVLIGLSSVSRDGLCGAVFQCVSQTLILCGLFLCFCFIVQIFKTTKLPFMGSLATYAPKLAALTFILMLSAAGLPFTSGFMGKFLCILGGFSTQIYSQNTIWICTLFIFIGFALGALYLIKVYQNIFFGPPVCESLKTDNLLRHRFTVLAGICTLVVLLGIMPYIILWAITKYADMIISVFLI